MLSFGREGRFMTPALEALDYKALQNFFKEIGVETHAPDGFRIFPVGHNSGTIIDALKKEMQQLGVEIVCNQKVISLLEENGSVYGLMTKNKTFLAEKIIIATGGKGYPQLGAEGDGYTLAKTLGHQITEIHPAMMPLKTKEQWGANCRADTIAKVELRVNIKKYKKLHATGDLIFTKNGIRGPVVLDFSREITPLLAKFNEVPILMNLTKGMNEEEIRRHFKEEIKKKPTHTTLSLVETLLPTALSIELCNLAHAAKAVTLKKLTGEVRDELIKLLAWTPLTINGHDGFKMAMITRGGISLKEIDPHTMQSKKVDNLYFCGEVMNLDGPCGGYNLQWSFSSGFLAGKSY
jgi:predicted Rossmann fold flavoprotein